MDNEIVINSLYDLFLYLDDINGYVNSILYYHYINPNIDLDEILMYLSCVDGIIDAVKNYISKNLC